MGGRGPGTQLALWPGMRGWAPSCMTLREAWTAGGQLTSREWLFFLMAPIAQQFPWDSVCVWYLGLQEPRSRRNPLLPKDLILGGLEVGEGARQIRQFICVSYGWPLSLVPPRGQGLSCLLGWQGVFGLNMLDWQKEGRITSLPFLTASTHHS